MTIVIVDVNRGNPSGGGGGGWGVGGLFHGSCTRRSTSSTGVTVALHDIM